MFGITFANPAMLYGLWAALLPLVIHLLNRRRTVSVPFSNVALLQALQRDRMRRVKLKQIVLLILRTLLLVLLVLAFSRPTLQGAQSGGEDVRTTAVLLLDRSLSMQYRTPEGTLFERAKARLQETLGLFDARDEVQVVVVDDRAEEVDSGTLDRLKARVDVLRPGFRETQLETGLVDALATLRASQMLNRELYIFSDLARNGWEGVPDSLDFQGVSVFVVPERPLVQHNLGVLNAGPVGQILTVGTQATLSIELANYGDTPKSGVAVQVFLDGRRIGQQVLTLPKKGSKRLYVPFVPERGGTVPLRVEIGDDNLIADNVYVSVLNIPERVSVLIVGDSADAGYFVERALFTRSTLLVQQGLPADLTPDLLAQTDVVFLCNVSRLSRGAQEALTRRVESGAGLMVFLGDRVDVRYYNQAFAKTLLPVALISVQGLAGGAYQRIQTHASDHPLLSHLGADKLLQDPRFYTYYRLRPKTDTQAVFTLGNGAPLLVEGRVGNGKVMVFASGIQTDLKWTDLPLSGFFVPFLHQAVHYLGIGAFGRREYQVGESVYREVRGQAPREALVRPPQGEDQTIWPEQRGPRPVWPVGEVGVPGLWKIYAQERLSDQFAVHVAHSESDLSIVSDRRLEAIGARVVDSGESLADVVLTTRHGRELWRAVLLAALLMMIAEMLIVRSAQTERSGAESAS